MSRGKAAAEVVMFQNEAEAAGWKQSVAAFGEGGAFARYTLYRKMAAAYRDIMVNTKDSPIMQIFQTFGDDRAARRSPNRAIRIGPVETGQIAPTHPRTPLIAAGVYRRDAPTCSTTPRRRTQPYGTPLTETHSHELIPANEAGAGSPSNRFVPAGIMAFGAGLVGDRIGVNRIYVPEGKSLLLRYKGFPLLGAKLPGPAWTFRQG